uniref:Serine/threonine-protein kinase TOR n=1 Tax=Strongyloides venezuelensis TaxID=75913 RepID=A0A0K0FU45_STRVS
MTEKFRKDVEEALEVFNEYQYSDKEGNADKLEFVLSDISTYISKIPNVLELYSANKIVSSMFNTMVTKVSSSKIIKDSWDLLSTYLLQALIDNEDLRLILVNEYDMITSIARLINQYTGEDYNTEAALENLLKILQILSIEGFSVSDESFIGDLLEFLTKSLASRKNNNITKLASRLITNICFSYPSYSRIVLENRSYIASKKALFNEVVFQIPSLMTSYMSFIIHFDSLAKQRLDANDNLLKILLFNFNALKNDEPYLKVYICRFIESLLFDEVFKLTKLGETWCRQKYGKMCMKEIFKILPIIAMSSEDLGVMYGFLYNLSLNEETGKIIYDLLVKDSNNENVDLFDSHVFVKAFNVASECTASIRISDETKINAGLFVYKIIMESIEINGEFCSGEKKNNIVEYLKTLIAAPTISEFEVPERVRIEKAALFSKLCLALSKDKSFINIVPKILTTKLADQLYELQTKYIPRIKMYLRHNSGSLNCEIIRAVRLTPLLLKALSAYEECQKPLEYILSKPDVAEFLSVGLMSKDLNLIEEIISSFEISLPSPTKKQVASLLKIFNNVEKIHVEGGHSFHSQGSMKQLKEELEESIKLGESYKSQVYKLKEEIEKLKEKHENVCLEQSKKYEDLKRTMERVAHENEQLACLKENMKNLLL